MTQHKYPRTLEEWRHFAGYYWIFVGGPKHGLCTSDDKLHIYGTYEYRYTAIHSLEDECLVHESLSPEAAELAFLSLVEESP